MTSGRSSTRSPVEGIGSGVCGRQYVFGYGSLVGRHDGHRGRVEDGDGRCGDCGRVEDGDGRCGDCGRVEDGDACSDGHGHVARGRLVHLVGYRRAWSVAMDNSVDIPGYKCYVDPLTGRRPDVFVAFLNISVSPGDRVNGRLSEVSTGDLAELDRRERNYARVDVTHGMVDGVGGTVWCYVGTRAARARFARGLDAGRVVIQAEYNERVRRAFADAGPDALAEFDRLTAPPACRIVGLRRVDL